MEDMDLMTAIIVIVFGILNLILFFKIWGMTNNVVEMRRMLAKIADSVPETAGEDSRAEDPEPGAGFKAGQLVVIKMNEEQFRIDSVKKDGDKVFYFSRKHDRYFLGDDIEDFERYWNARK